MEKRVLIAIGLSMAILLLWSKYVLKFYPIENKEVREKSLEAIPSEPLQREIIEEKIENFSTEKFDLELNTISGSIKGIFLRDYEYKFPFEDGFLMKEKGANLVFESLFKEEKIVFSCQDEERIISKVINFPKYKNFINLELNFRNLSEKELDLNLDLLLFSWDLGRDKEESRFWEIGIFKSDRILRQNPLRIKQESFYREDIQTVGVKDRYFCALLKSEESISSFIIKRSNGKRVELILPLRIRLSPNKADSKNFLVYLGPQDVKILKSIDPRFLGIIYFGFFDFISKFLLDFLEVLYRVCRNWGFAIVLLTFFIFLFFYPLTLKQLRSTRQLQALQPEIENLRRLYKDNPQRLNREIMEFYRRKKINPFGGCLPLFLQIPIFFSLYQALSRSFNLRGANFLWIRDLSRPENLFGKNINILPIFMVLMMLLQQKMSGVSLTKEQKEQQKMMNIFLPFLFGFIFYNMPSGLVLYWSTHTLLTLLFQSRILKPFKV